jgi:NADH-quinone oxidoreductase subunit N
MNLTAFGLVSFFSQISGSERMASFAGLGSQRPLAAVATVVVMVALAVCLQQRLYGQAAHFLVPVGKLADEWQWLVVLFSDRVLNVAVSLFYYLKIPFYLFFRPAGELNGTQTGIYGGLLIAALTLPVVFSFLSPSGFSGNYNLLIGMNANRRLRKSFPDRIKSSTFRL